MPNPERAHARACGLCKPHKKWPASRRKRKVVRDAIKEG